MHRVDSFGHDSNMFTDGDPGIGEPATLLEEDWHNAVQEAICIAIEDAGITLVKGDDDQLSEAITALAEDAIAAAFAAAVTMATGLTISGTSHLSMTGTQPTATASYTDARLTSSNVPVAWAIVNTDGAGNVTLVDGFNIASVNITSAVVNVVLNRSLGFTSASNCKLCPIAMSANGGTFVSGFATSATNIQLTVKLHDGSTQDPTATSVQITLMVFGKT